MTQMVKNPPANAGNETDAGLISELGRSPGVGNGNPLQYSSLKNSLDRGAWQATVHGVVKTWTQLSTHIRPTLLSVTHPTTEVELQPAHQIQPTPCFCK